MGPRIEPIYAALKEKGLDGLLVSSPANISYLVNFRSSESYLFISKKKNTYLTDFRYLEEANKSLNKKVFSITRIGESVFKSLAGVIKESRAKRIGFEERELSFGEYAQVKKELGAAVDLIPTHGIIEARRAIKSSLELEKIRKAALIAVKAMRFSEGCISPGKKEIEIAAELERFIRLNGAYASSFDIIVASGPNSSIPHHVTSERRIRNNEPVLVDMGVDYLGYKSDLTRVFFLGRMSSVFKKIYTIVLESQVKALQAIRPGLAVNELDMIARRHIAKAGYGGFFGHSLGHGVGLEIHEAPHLSGKARDALKTGMVFTVEPGIYLPGKFGVRIEDMCLVTQKGAEVLSGVLNK